ncbi:hypothetical protein ACFX13_026589 [Malus domestica]
MDDSQSYSWNSVRLEGKPYKFLHRSSLLQCPTTLMPTVGQCVCDSKVTVQVHQAAIVDVLKAIISEHHRHLDFNLPTLDLLEPVPCT